MEAQFAIRVRQFGHPSNRWQLKSCGADVYSSLQGHTGDLCQAGGGGEGKGPLSSPALGDACSQPLEVC